MTRPHLTTLVFLASLMALPALAQTASVAFGTLKQDTTLPVEVTAETLAVNQSDGTATFSGNVLVGQGEMRLSAAEVRVEYGAGGDTISRLLATGGVTFANAGEAAEAEQAVYSVAEGTIVMTGNVLLTQGASALSGEKLTVDLASGTGKMEGGVRTVFTPGKAP